MMQYLKALQLTTGLAVVGYFLYKSGRIYLMRKKYSHIPGPKTKGLIGFFVGNIYDTFELIRDGKIFPEILAEWHEKYGEVFKMQLFDQIFVVTTNTEEIRDILIKKNYPKNNDVVYKAVAFPFNERFLGIGLVTDPDNSRWKHRRSLFNTGFHRSVLTTFISEFNSKADILMERLRTLADGKRVITLFNEINHATLDVISRIAFGLNIDSINETDAELSNSMATILKAIDDSLRDPFIQIKPHTRRQIKRAKEYIRAVRDIGKEKILERLNDMKAQNYVPVDILSTILNNWDESDLDLEDMIDDFITFLFAGQETTANALSFCFLELGKNKELFLKARQEIDQLLGERTHLTYQDTVDLKLCAAILKEALRLYPVVPLIDRFVTDEREINGLKIPKDTCYAVSTFVSSRSEKHFSQPLEFRPERFLKTNQETGGAENFTNYTYYPFSIGPRNCIGQNFAQIEAVIVMAKLIRQFDYTLDPEQSFSIAQNITLRPKDGTRCILTLRE